MMVWSSAAPNNVKGVCEKLFNREQRKRVVAEWARNTLDLSKDDYRQKVQVYKQLTKIWNNNFIQSAHPQYQNKGRWDQTNTVLIDDSIEKVSAHPHNHIEVPEFISQNRDKIRKKVDAVVLKQVLDYLEELRTWDNVSSYINKVQRFSVNVKDSIMSEKSDSVDASNSQSYIR